jgi:hypothetical protein
MSYRIEGTFEGRQLALTVPSDTIACFAYYADVLREEASQACVLGPVRSIEYASTRRFFVETTRYLRHAQGELVASKSPVEIIRGILVEDGHEIDEESFDRASCALDIPCYNGDER